MDHIQVTILVEKYAILFQYITYVEMLNILEVPPFSYSSVDLTILLMLMKTIESSCHSQLSVLINSYVRCSDPVLISVASRKLVSPELII